MITNYNSLQQIMKSNIILEKFVHAKNVMSIFKLSQKWRW